MVECSGLVQNARMVTLETSRLLLRRWRQEDAVPLTAVNAVSEVMRWIGDGGDEDGGFLADRQHLVTGGHAPAPVEMVDAVLDRARRDR